ncbi:unnamed protein product, partial [marine sediment metagenome]
MSKSSSKDVVVVTKKPKRKGDSGSKKHRKHDRDKKKCDLYRRQGKREKSKELRKE